MQLKKKLQGTVTALTMEKNGIVVGEGCRMCGLCVRQCPVQAIRFEQRANEMNKEDWKDFLVLAEQDNGKIHPVTLELVG